MCRLPNMACHIRCHWHCHSTVNLLQWSLRVAQLSRFVHICTPPGTSCSKSLCGGILYGVGTAGVYLNSCDPTGGLLTVAQCLPIFVHMQVRGKIRSHYKIKTDCCYDECCDGGCDDFCCAMCCYSCALAQESRMLTESLPTETDVHYPHTMNLPHSMGDH